MGNNSLEDGFPTRWEESLKRVRKCLDDSIVDSRANFDVDSSKAGSHRLIVMFNILIGNIIDEAVVQVINNEKVSLSPESTRKPSKPLHMHSKAESMTNIHLNKSTDEKSYFSQDDAMQYAYASGMKGADPHTLLARSLPMHYTEIAYRHSPVKMSGSTDDPDSLFRNPSLKLNNDLPVSADKTTGCYERERRQSFTHSGETKSEWNYKIPIKSCNSLTPSLATNQEDNKQKARLTFLLSLILSFVRLKESIGLERSILSNLMVTRDSALTHQSSSKLFTGLVVEDANQRMIIRELQSQSKKVMKSQIKNLKNLLLLMEDKLKPGKEMERLQEMIRTNFNLEELRKAMPFEKFWGVISIYMDKLHSMELILVEEIQSTWIQLSFSEKIEGFNEKKRSLSQNSLASLFTALNNEEDEEKQHLYEIFLPKEQDKNDKKWTDEEAFRALARIPADQIKKALLSHLKEDNTDNTTIMTRSTFTTPIDRNMEPSQIPKLLKEWDIDLYEIEFRRRIGRGVGGTTYLAKWSGQDVAVKVAAITDLGVEGWHTEVNSLKRLHHPNVIRLLGSIYNHSPQTYGLVLEYCESGDLSSALQRATPSNFFWRVADDVANGMNYLHKKNILHRDIKPANVLLNGDVMGGNFTAKLSDFGVAIMHHSSVGEEHTAETGTYRWMAPEIIRHEAYSFMADVYSYALVVWQLVTHEIPFKNLSQIEAAGKVAVDSARPPLPPKTPELIVALIEICWKECPEERLSFAQITVELREIHKAMSHHEKDWLGMQNGHPVYDIPAESEQLVKSISSKELLDAGKKKDGKLGRKNSSSKSPNTSGKGGGLFSIFQQNKNR